MTHSPTDDPLPDNVEPVPDLADLPVAPPSAPSDDADEGEGAPPAEDLTLPAD